MQQIRTDFASPVGNASFCSNHGGTIDRRAPWVCVIRANGEVMFRQVPVS
jgi:hypothetical protein